MVYEMKAGVSETVLAYKLPSETELRKGILFMPGCAVYPVEICKIVIDNDGIHYYWDEYNELCSNDLVITTADLKEHGSSGWIRKLFEENEGQDLAFPDEEMLIAFVRKAAEAYELQPAYTPETCPYALSAWMHKPCLFHGQSLPCDHLNPAFCPFAASVSAEG